MKRLIDKYCERHQRKDCPIAPEVSVDIMVCDTLRILSGAIYMDVPWPYGISLKPPYTIVEQTILKINKAVPNISFTTTEEECRWEAEKFCRLRWSPMVGEIGALDGIAIEIRKPWQNNGPDSRKQYNRKGFFAWMVPAVASTN